MTSTIRVSEIKKQRSVATKKSDGKPREGSRLRQVYDSLRRGEIVEIGSYATQLRDFYGMDLKTVYTTGRRGPVGSRLVGEWDGPYYVPIERILVTEQ